MHIPKRNGEKRGRHAGAGIADGIGVGAGIAAHDLVLQRDSRLFGQGFQLPGQCDVQGGRPAQHGAFAQFTAFGGGGVGRQGEADIGGNGAGGIDRKGGDGGSAAAQLLLRGEDDRHIAEERDTV